VKGGEQELQCKCSVQVQKHRYVCLYYQLKIRFLVSQRKCQAGLQAAVRLGITRLSLEVDASLVKDAIKTDDYRLASIGGIVTEIKHIISDELSTCPVSVCKRD